MATLSLMIGAPVVHNNSSMNGKLFSQHDYLKLQTNKQTKKQTEVKVYKHSNLWK